jgi:hypothetical protein
MTKGADTNQRAIRITRILDSNFFILSVIKKHKPIKRPQIASVIPKAIHP